VRNVVLVFFGGALGSVSRYLVATWAATRWGPDVPRGTLIVNVAGSLLIAVVMGLSVETAAIPPAARLFLTTGIMGGFTTYSSFNYETLHLLEEGMVGRALLNMGLTVVACLASGALGLALARLALRAGSP
jgi:CrcB protein